MPSSSTLMAHRFNICMRFILDRYLSPAPVILVLLASKRRRPRRSPRRRQARVADSRVRNIKPLQAGQAGQTRKPLIRDHSLPQLEGFEIHQTLKLVHTRVADLVVADIEVRQRRKHADVPQVVVCHALPGKVERPQAGDAMQRRQNSLRIGTRPILETGREADRHDIAC